METKEQKIERLKKQKKFYTDNAEKEEDFFKKQYDVEMVSVIEQQLKELEYEKRNE